MLVLALMQSASFSTSIVPALVAAGANVNSKCNAFDPPCKGDRTPLMLAAEQGAADLMRTLIEAKADQTAVDSGGSTAVDLLLEAVKLEHGNVVHALRVSGVDVNVRNKVHSPEPWIAWGRLGGPGE